MENFDYKAAVAELEKLASKVEDPSTGLEDVDVCIRRADELVAACREYLRSARQKTESL